LVNQTLIGSDAGPVWRALKNLDFRENPTAEGSRNVLPERQFDQDVAHLTNSRFAAFNRFSSHCPHSAL
jgi:hypothetical protein